MADVFISYARANEQRAKAIAEALESCGFSVWIDEALPAHRRFAEVIEEQIEASKAVLVLWSREAVKSEWVRAEADAGRNASKLVQVKLDAIHLPMPFNQFHCIDLHSWAGEISSPRWRKVQESIEVLSGRRESTNPVPAPAFRQACRTSICVLPFVNMSGDREQEYFSDGISEDITTDLSRVSALEVIARNTAMVFKGTSMDAVSIACRIGVSHLLEGSVRKAAGRVRINAQLIDGRTGSHVWAERYDRELTDIFAIQDEISKAIVDALKVKLLPGEKEAIEQRGTENVDAYNLYLMARQYWVTGNHGDRTREERVERICQRAVEIDDGYAQAWALMAIAQSSLRFGFGRPGDGGKAAAERALELDAGIAEAYCVTSRLLAERGNHEEAIAEMRKGLAIDPLSWEVNKWAGFLLMQENELEEATAHYEQAVAVMDGDYHGWGMLSTCYQARKDPRAKQIAEKALQECERVLAQDPSNGAAISFAVGALASLGEAARAKEWIVRALLIDPDNLNMRYNFACGLSILGERDAAIAMLESSQANARGSLGMLEVDSDLDNIRDDPRFQAIVARAKKRITEDKAQEAELATPPASGGRSRS